MSRVLKKLFLGDVVAKGTTRQLRKLTTEKPQEPETDPYGLIGTWVFNDTAPENGVYVSYFIDFNSAETNYNAVTLYPLGALYYLIRVEEGYEHYNAYSTTDNDEGWKKEAYKTITITGGADITNEEFATWLKANATKQESIVGTWVFNNTVNITEQFSSGYNVDFICGGIEYHYFEINADDNVLYFGTGTLSSPDDFVHVYGDNSWLNTTYKTISVIGSNDSMVDELLIWFKANATKIA